MPRCIVAGCSSKQNKSTAMRGVILHVFPPNVERIKAWLMHIGQDFGDLDEFAQRVLHSKKNGSFRLCSDHFTPQSYVEHASKKLLRVDAVPTLFNVDATSRPCANKAMLNASGNNYSTVSMPSTTNISCATSNTFPSYKDVASRTDLYRKTKEASTQTHQHNTSNTVKKSPECNALSNVVTDPNKIDEIRKKLTERILQFTLEIIYLLIGEECSVVKKTSGDHLTPTTYPHGSGAWSRSQGFNVDPLPTSLTPEKSYNKILEVTNKISKLLTGEVPIWSQDVMVSFSMEEGKDLGQKDIKKDVMMASQTALTSLVGSSYRNTPEGCPYPLYSTREQHKISNDQGENMVIIKVEVKEEPDESYVICGEPCREEEISTEIGTVSEDPKATERNVKTEEEEGGLLRIKEEEVPKAISTDPGDSRTTPQDIKIEEEEEEEIQVRIKVEEEEEEIQVRKIPMEEEIPMEIGTDGTYKMPNGETDDEPTDVSSDDYPVTTTSNPLLHSTHFSPDPPTHGGTFSDHSYPIPLRTDTREGESAPCPEKGKGPHMCSLCKKCFSDKSVLRHHENTHKREVRYTCFECGKTFLHNSRFISHRRIHTGERPFTCSKCGKSFVNKPDLVRHHRTHTGEKPFSCTDCGKRFTQRVHLVTHQKKHTIQKC